MITTAPTSGSSRKSCRCSDRSCHESSVESSRQATTVGAKPRSESTARNRAASGAEKARKRLPTKAEWQLAAGGPQGLEYPYGNIFDPARAVTGRSLEDGPLPCGSRLGDRSPCGAYDMSGNVSEWIEELDLCGGNWTSIQPFASSTKYSLPYEQGEGPPFAGFRRVLDLAGRQLPPAPTQPAVPRAKSSANPRATDDVVLDRVPADMVEIRPEPGTPAFKLVSYRFCIDRYEYPNKKGEMPQGELTWEKAAELARSAGKRLPTLNEWRVACGGKDLVSYPWGGSYKPGILRIKLEREDGPARSGSLPQAVSPFGVFDMNGNLSEWVFNEERGLWGVAGGCWISYPDGATALSWEEAPGPASKTVGFRCVARLKE